MSLFGRYVDLKDKSVLVTGANRGIGKAIAKQLAMQKCHVILNYRGDREKIQPLYDELKSETEQVSLLAFDVTDVDGMREKLTEFCKSHGPIEGLVNNAGISKDTLILRLKESELQEIIKVNLQSAIMITSILSRYFLKVADASIVNISSVVGLMGNSSQVAYAASKAGLIGFSKSLAKELGSKNIRCNTICPGLIATDMTDSLSDDVKQKYLQTIPLGRPGQAQEVANLTSFLLSKASSYITGEVIKVDGGLYI